MISLKIDEHGAVMDNAWEGKCREPGEPCPTSCQPGTGGTTTCYKCNISATCEGSLVCDAFN